MTEQRVTLETAKLAKEKGFDIDSKYYISESNDDYLFYLREKKKVILIHQPTQSLLQKWLREKHNFHISADPIGNNGNEWRYRIQNIILTLDSSWDIEPISHFKSYELALEAGLQEALKLIPEKK